MTVFAGLAPHLRQLPENQVFLGDVRGLQRSVDCGSPAGLPVDAGRDGQGHGDRDGEDEDSLVCLYMYSESLIIC